MQPSVSSLNSFGFLTSLHDSVSLVANGLSVRFIISQVFAHVMASGATLVCVFNSLGTLVEIESPPFIAVCGSEVLLLSQDSSVKTLIYYPRTQLLGHIF